MNGLQHCLTQNPVDSRLVALTLTFQPSQHVGIHPNRGGHLDGLVKAPSNGVGPMHITQRLNIAGIDVALRNFGQRLQLGRLCLGQGRQLALFVPNRFDRLTPQEKRYLRAMSELGPEPHRSGAIADGLKREVISLGPVRSSLIVKGMIWSPNHGDPAFTVPLFDEFMRRIMPGQD